MQPIVTIQDDGVTAKGRFRTLMQCGQHDEAMKNHPNPQARENPFRSFWEGISQCAVVGTDVRCVVREYLH
jgi:hypothetical protein